MNHATSTTTRTLAPVPEASKPEAQPLPIPLRNQPDQAQLDVLWAMTKQQRTDAMWAGRLTMFQLCEWSGKRPSEVPLLGREFAWHVMRTPEWADEAEARQDNVVHLPESRRPDRAAA
jgi:hypothetical protein